MTEEPLLLQPFKLEETCALTSFWDGGHCGIEYFSIIVYQWQQIKIIFYHNGIGCGWSCIVFCYLPYYILSGNSSPLFLLHESYGSTRVDIFFTLWR